MRLRGKCQMMLAAENSIILTKLSSCLFAKKNGRKYGITLAKKTDLPDTSKTQQGISFPLRISSTFLAQSAIGVLGLGFIDAGYSGDWSRIGVISKETEDLLKVGAFIVVPLCLLLIFKLSKGKES